MLGKKLTLFFKNGENFWISKIVRIHLLYFIINDPPAGYQKETCQKCKKIYKTDRRRRSRARSSRQKPDEQPNDVEPD